MTLAALEARAGADALYAIADGTASEEIVARLEQASSPLEHRCFFPGAGEELKAIAPHLVAPDTAFCEWFLSAGRGESWGVFFCSSAELAEVEAHCQSVFRARTEDGARILFRYFDPRILAAYLPSCTPEELARFFGPIRSFFCEDAEGEWIEHTLEGGALRRRRLSGEELEPAPAPVSLPASAPAPGLDALVSEWEAFAAGSLESPSLGALSALPADTRAECAALLTPALEGRLGASARAALSTWLSACGVLQEVGAELERLHQQVAEGTNPSEDELARIPPALLALADRVEPVAADSAELGRVVRTLHTREKILARRVDKGAHAMEVSLHALRVSLHLDHDSFARARALVDGALDALRASAEAT